MAGLAAGIRCALSGQSVLILEKHNVPGGLNSFYFKGSRKCDVGLHAVTNFVEPGVKGTPLGKLCRQLRIPRDAFELSPQWGSRIAFPCVDLCFTNDFKLLEEEIGRKFPKQSDAFQNLRRAIAEIDPFGMRPPVPGARQFLRGHLSDPYLIEMLLCPLMYYGSARENDMDLDQFVIMWRAVFEEGFARPLGGVRVIIRALLDKYRSLGGERKMKTAVASFLRKEGKVVGVRTGAGEEILAKTVLSTIGWPETLRLLETGSTVVRARTGRLGFVETMTFFEGQPAEIGCRDTIVFFNDSPEFDYERPQEAVDPRSGVICFPNNYAYPEGQQLDEGILRLTALANPDIWRDFSPVDYAAAKEVWAQRLEDSAIRFLPGLNLDEFRSRRRFHDMFTPLTVTRYTSHLDGTIYGSPDKQRDGFSGYEGLFIAGTDQGFLGIIGAMLSGVSMANRHCLG